MNKNLIIKYIRGQCTPSESREVEHWISRNEENSRYYTRLLNLWIAQQMPAEEASDQELAEMYEYITKSGFQNRKQKGFYVSLKAVWIGAACVIALLVLVIGMPSEKVVQGTFADPGILHPEECRMFYTDPGIKGRIVLPDSSVVWLNSGSTLWYPGNFSAQKREVVLSGEGYFEVNRDPERPMIVRTSKNFHIEVLGTVFNLKSYEDEDTAVATLYSGNINVILGDGSAAGPVIRKLAPNESIVIYGNHTTHIAPIDSPAQHSGWKDGLIVFENTPVREAIKTLERWHGVTFVIESKEIMEYRITARFQSESVVQIMDLIRKTSYLDYRIEDNKVFLKKR